MNTPIDPTNPLGFSPSDLKLPSPSAPFYTVDEYERAVRSGKSHSELLAHEEANGRGFGFVYMDTLHALTSEYIGRRFRAVIAAQLDEDDDYRIRDALEEMAALRDIVRRKLAIRMQKYIRKRGGVIDCWPEELADMRPEADRREAPHFVQDVFAIFGYFDPRINWYRKESVLRLGTIAFRNAYDFHADDQTLPELTSLEEQMEKLCRVPFYTRKQQRSSNFRYGIAVVPSVYLFLCALLLIVWKLFPASFVDAKLCFGLFSTLHPAASAVLALPLILYALPAALYPFLNLWAPLVWIAAISLIGLGLFLLSECPKLLFNAKWISKKTMKAGQDAAAELQRLKRDERTVSLTKLNAKLRSDNEILAKTWQKAWFDAVCSARS